MQASSTDSRYDLPQSFRELSSEFARAAARANIPVTPFHDPKLPHFSQLPEQHQLLGCQYLARHLEVFAQLEGAKESPLDSPRFIWRALKELGFVPSSSIFDKIDREDVVEIYDLSFNQHFRNLNFFQYVTITLEEICSIAIPNLVEFPEGLVQTLVQCATRVRNEGLTEPVSPGIPPYVWMERQSLGLKRGETHVKWMVPVRNATGDCVVLVVNRTKNV